MSVESMSRALNAGGLIPAAKLLLVGIANHDGDGGAWPSTATLSRYVGVSERTVRRLLVMLVDAGLVSVDVNGGGTLKTRGDRRPNRYHLHLSGVVDIYPTGGAIGPPVGVTGGRSGSRRVDTAMSTEPSLEPSTITTSTDLTSPPPDSGFLSLDAYFKAHPDEAPRVTRWAKGLTDRSGKQIVDV